MTALTLQLDNFSCGAVAFQNAMKVMGEEYDIDSARDMVGTTKKKGTSKAGLVRGVEKAGYKAVVYRQRNGDLAWRWLRKWSPTNPVILLVDGNEHWLLAHGKSNGSVIIIDPTVEIKKKENGVFLLDKEDTLFRWKHAIHYAVLVKRR
jgi:ABC-type bacteriocin/lantibiotic exporter with double-glycine peptidase domain